MSKQFPKVPRESSEAQKIATLIDRSDPAGPERVRLLRLGDRIPAPTPVDVDQALAAELTRICQMISPEAMSGKGSDDMMLSDDYKRWRLDPSGELTRIHRRENEE